jgi:hypothetical protein
MKTVFAQISDRLRPIALWIGKKQTFLIYSLLYFVIIGPVAIVHSLLADPFQYRKRMLASFWSARRANAPSLEEALRQ